MIGTTKAIAPFKPLPWQIEPWRDKSPILLLTGSAGGGKSRLAAEKVNAYMLKYPRAMGVMLRKTRNSMTNSTVLFMERTVIAKTPGVRHYPSKNRFEYDNGSILAYGGMANEEQREQIRSIGQDGSVDILWKEEANKFVENDLNEVLPRMRGKAAPWQQIILSTNPDAPAHFINKRLILGGEAAVYYSRAADNTYNPPSYLETLDKLTGVLRLRLRDGKWVQAEGAVYPDFDAGIHVIDPFEIPLSWRRIRSIDFGYTNPFVCQWWAIDHDGRMYLYREIYMSKRIVSDHAADILAAEADKETIEATPADHDAEDRATLEDSGIYTTLAIKDVSRGIQMVQQRLRKAGDGKPRIFFLRGALVETDNHLESKRATTGTIDEFPAYAWQAHRDGRPLKEDPVKTNDHGMDAMRYAVMYLEDGGATWDDVADLGRVDNFESRWA